MLLSSALLERLFPVSEPLLLLERAPLDDTDNIPLPAYDSEEFRPLKVPLSAEEPEIDLLEVPDTVDPRLVTLPNSEVLEVRILDEALLLLDPKLEPPKKLWLLETALLLDSDRFALPD